MESLAALALAGNVLQFVTFSQKLVGKSIEVYGSASGATSFNQQLNDLNTDLDDLCSNIETRAQQLGNAQSLHNRELTDRETHLLELARGCRNLAQEFQRVLDKLKVDGNRKRKRWTSVRAALKSIWNEKTIEDYTSRLNAYREQIAVRLIEVLTIQNTTVVSTLDDLTNLHRSCSATFSDEFRSMKSQIIEAAKAQSHQQSVEMGSPPPAISAEGSSDLTGSLALQPKATASNEIPAKSSEEADIELLPTLVAKLLQAAENMDLDLRIIQSLRFDQMDSRESAIVNAHSETFSWATVLGTSFGGGSSTTSKPRANTIIDWIQSNESAFWITGKPGSGKSTLMKYLSSNRNVKQTLQAWASPKSLCVGSFYFWNAGSSAMQRSQQGLLQTLLFHVFRQSPSMIPILAPDRWRKPFRREAPWSWDELATAFKVLGKLDTYTTKYCFFIDGLDEYEGDHEALITVVNSMASEHVKVCFSSRPWNVFEHAYGRKLNYIIRVHEHTERDIAKYAHDELLLDSRLATLQTKNPDFSKLVPQITARAEGVFLWVFLVVNSLRRGLRNDDTIVDLQRRLDMLPDTLEGFYQHMLHNVEEVYRQQSASIYLMCLASTHRALRVHRATCVNSKDGDLAMLSAPEDWSHFRLDNFHLDENRQLSIKRLKARCPDLLDVQSEHDFLLRPIVRFLHRTARDFLASEPILNELRKASRNFDPELYLCHAAVAEFLSLPDKLDWPLKISFEVGIEVIYKLKIMADRNISDSEHRAEIIDMVLSIVQPLNKEGLSMIRDELVLHAINVGSMEYIQRESAFVTCMSNSRRNSGLLSGALHITSRYMHYNHIRVDMLCLLIRLGASPKTDDFHFGGLNLFLSLLLRVSSCNDTDAMTLRTCAEALKVLLNHGADPEVPADHKYLLDPERASRVRDTEFDKNCPSRIYERAIAVAFAKLQLQGVVAFIAAIFPPTEAKMLEEALSRYPLSEHGSHILTEWQRELLDSDE